MSLTSELDDPRSAVSLFLAQRFPNLKALRDWTRPQLATFAGPPTIAPPQMIRDRPALLGTIGMAVDYRLRYYFAVTPPDEFVARIGASRLLYLMPSGDRPAWQRLIARLFGETIPSITDRLAPVGSRLSDPQEKELCQLCYLLAFFEEMYRAPPQYVMQSRLLSLERAGEPTMDDLLAMGKEMGVEAELARLSHAFYDTLGSLIESPAVLNPVFAGSGDVGGADADLILDGCLLEIKTSVGKERLTRERLYQLIGYVLLDYNDEHCIRDLGIYFTRHAALLGWSLEQFVMLLGGDSIPPLDVLRDQFRSALCSTT